MEYVTKLICERHKMFGEVLMFRGKGIAEF